MIKKRVVKSQQNKIYPTEKLIKSKQLARYQQDFVRAILTEKEYTVSGAVGILEKKLKGDE